METSLCQMNAITLGVCSACFQQKTLPHRIFSAWYGPWVKPKLRSSLHCTSTESGQNTVIHRIPVEILPGVFLPWFLGENIQQISTNSDAWVENHWTKHNLNIFCSRKEHQEGEGRQAREQIRNVYQNVSFIPWDAGLYLMHPRCCSCFFQQYLSSFTEPGKMMGLRAWRSSPQGLLSVVEGGLEEMFCWLPVTLTF